jgi:hypothetical protein
MNEKVPNRRAGGIARADNLSSAERSKIAHRAAAARWKLEIDPLDPPVLRTVQSGNWELGGWLIGCHYLNDGKRVITQRSFMTIIGMKGRGTDIGHRMAHFLQSPVLKSNKINTLVLAIRNPIRFRMLNNVEAFGYEGSIIVDYCKAVLEARRTKGIEGEVAHRYADACERFVTACAKTGIVAIIDEVTGHREHARKTEYRELFKEFIRNEFRQWEKEFPDQFFDMIYRIYGLERKPAKNHPQFFAGFIRQYVYRPLANSNGAILEMLDEKNPIVRSDGGRKYKLHQFLTDIVGLPALRAHLWQIVGIGNSVLSKGAFHGSFERAFPQVGDQIEFELMV